MTEIAVSRYPAPTLARGANVTAKAGLLVMLAVAVVVVEPRGLEPLTPCLQKQTDHRAGESP